MCKHLNDLVCQKIMKNFVVLLFLPLCLSQKYYGNGRNSNNLVKLPDQYQQKYYSPDYGYPEYPIQNPGYSAYPGYPAPPGYPSGYYSSGYPDPPSEGTVNFNEFCQLTKNYKYNLYIFLMNMYLVTDRYR